MKLTGLILLISFMVGCASTAEGPTADDAAAAIAAAKAAAENYEWRDTAELIKQAETAMNEGKNAEAVKLANIARRQAENAVNQKYGELVRLGTAALTTVSTADAGTSYEMVTGDNQ